MDGLWSSVAVTMAGTPQHDNITGQAQENEFDSRLSAVTDYLLGSYMILIGVLTILLNLVVLVTVGRRRRSCSPLELLVVNLALGDLVVGIVAYPPLIWACFVHSWRFGITLCRVYATTVYFFGTSSISTLTSMSLLRYLKTCHPSLERHLSRPAVYATLGAIYVNSAVWAGGPLLGWGRYGLEPFGLSCTLDWRHLSVSYIACVFLFVYVLPVFLITFSYGSMTSYVCRTQRAMILTNKRMDIYLTKMTAIMCTCFLVAWTPYAVVALCYVSHNYHMVPLPLTIAAPFLAKSATFYNPIVYFLSIKRFRNDVISVWFSSCVQVTEEAATTTTARLGLTERFCSNSIAENTKFKANGNHTKLDRLEVEQTEMLLLSQESSPDIVRSNIAIAAHIRNGAILPDNDTRVSKTVLVKKSKSWH